MLKNEQHRKLLVVCAVTVFVLVLLSLLEPGYKDICTNAQHAAHEDCPSYNLVYVGLWHVAKGLDAASAVITAIATALLTWVTVRLAALEKDGAETSRAQLRAYVLMEEGRIDGIEVGQVPHARIAVKNFGQTPAYDFRQASNMGLFPYPLPKMPPPLRKDGDPASILGPGAKIYMFPHSSGPLTVDEFKGLHKGTHAIFIAGEITYRDSFGRTQTASYLVFSGGGEVELGSVAPYVTGNSAT